MQSIVKAAAEC